MDSLLTPPSILITDDDREFREALSGVIEPQGFRTYQAEDGEQAVSIIRSQHIHLVLLDMHMPKLTGLETIRRVKQFNSRLPFILLSADADESLAEQAKLVQAFSVLAKPVSRPTILATVHLALRITYNWPG